MRLSTHIQLPIPPSRKKKKRWQGCVPILRLTFCSSSYVFTQVKVQRAKMPLNLCMKLGKNGFAYATPLVWNTGFPHPQDLLRNLYSFRQAGLTLQARFPLSIPIFLLKGVFIWCRHAPSSTRPMSLLESWPHLYPRRWVWMMTMTGLEAQVKAIKEWHLSAYGNGQFQQREQ